MVNYVINLKSSRNRLEMFRKNNLGQLKEIVVIDAVDGKESTFGQHPKYFNNIENYKNKKMNGNWGCYISHMKTWETIASLNDSKYHIVFEDDAILHKNFNGNVQTLLKNVPNNWDMIYLYRNSGKQGKNYNKYCYIPEPIIKPGFNTGWVCYMLNSKGAKKLLNNIELINLEKLNKKNGIPQLMGPDHYIKRYWKYINIYIINNLIYVKHNFQIGSDRRKRL